MKRNLAVPAILVLATLGRISGAEAQAAPNTDIFLVQVDQSGGSLLITSPVNLTSRPGYDNQPAFTPDGTAILFTSVLDDQADTYRVDLATGQVDRVTRTPESEYSPTPMPGGARFSAVRVEADSTQRLWSFALDGTDPQLLLEDVMPVGYHAWSDAGVVALFVLGSPPTLQVADIASGEARTVQESVGRSLHRVPGKNAISFVHKLGPDDWWIKELDLATGDVRSLARTRRGVEDYAWTPGGTLLMGDGARVFALDPESGSGWVQVADLEGSGLGSITRMAVDPSGKRAAIVAVPADPGVAQP
jgi:hypothetical protein